MSESILTISDVVVRYGGVVAVDHVSFELENGSINGLVGPNGSGKSTLLAAISGTRKANEGSIRFAGRETRQWTPWRLARHGLARTFQGARVVPELTVRDNVALGFDWAPTRGRVPIRQRRSQAASAIGEALETCGIAHLADGVASELSYGTQRLVEIARAVVARPRLLLLDEPTAGMNDLERSEIEAVQRALREQGVTQVLVEHNMAMVVRMCTQVYVLNSGALIASGTPAEIVNDPNVQQAYLGKAREHAAATADR